MAARLRRWNRMLTLVGVRIAGAALAGVLAVVVARAYGAEYSGRFFYLVSTITIASVITRLGVEPYLTERLAKSGGFDRCTRITYLSSTFAAVTSIVVVAGISAMAFEAVKPEVGERVFANVPIPLLMLAVMGLNATWIVTGYARARGMAGASIFLETGLLSLWLLALLGYSSAASVEPTAVLVSSSVALMLPAMILLVTPLWARTGFGAVSRATVLDAYKGIIGFGAVTVTNGIIVLIPLQVLGWNGMTDEAGIYNAALRVSMFVGAAGVVVKSMVVRSQLGGSSQGSRHRDLGISLLLALPWIAISLLITWQSRWLTVLFGSDFKGLEGIVLIMLIAQSLNVGAFFIETRAVLADERRILNFASVTTLLVSLPASSILIGEFGLQGAAYAFALTIVVSRAQLAWMYVRGGRSSAEPPRHRTAGRRPQSSGRKRM